MNRDLKTQQNLKEVLEGLKKSSKTISSKFFYDSKGSELFQKITQLDEYYLTRCEREILQSIGPSLEKHLGGDAVELIEIGPGDGSKGRLVLSQLLSNPKQIEYFGIDICDHALEELKKVFSSLPQKIDPQLVLGDYLKFSNLPLIKNNKRKVVCFFGSSIGNLSHAESTSFIQEVSQVLTDGDCFLIGFDLKKDHNIMTKAYNDSLGVTREFNLNLLTRFNREFGSNFDLSKFKHLEYYDEQLGAMVSYLISTSDQIVSIGDENIKFNVGEKIHTESSHKYDEKDIQNLISNSDLIIADQFLDSKKYFNCVLFKKVDQISRSKSQKIATNVNADTAADSKAFLWAT